VSAAGVEERAAASAPARGRRRVRRAMLWLAALAAVVAVPAFGMTLARRDEAGGARADEAAPRSAAEDEGAAPDAGAPDFVAVLLPPRMASLSPRSERKVLEVRARAGDAVRGGSVIVAFDLRDLRHGLESAEGQLAAARAEAAGARAELVAARAKASRRTASIDVRGRRIALVSGEEAAQARFEARGAGARATAAAGRAAASKARVEQLRVALEEGELRAPFDGVLSAVNVEPGMTVRPGEIAARVVGGRGLRARIAVPEESAGLLDARRARLVFGDARLGATIRAVSAEPEPAARVFVVEADVDDAGALCGAGEGCPALAGRTVRATLVAP